MTNLASILKSRDISLPTKIHLVKAMVFPVVMYGYESWTIKKVQGRRTDAFELCCWSTLESPLGCKEVQPVHPKGNQSWVFIGMTDAGAEVPILGHLMRRTGTLEKTLMLGKIEGRRRRGERGWDGWMASLTGWTWVWASSRSWWWTGKPGMLQSMRSQSQTRLSIWTEPLSIGQLQADRMVRWKELGLWSQII